MLRAEMLLRMVSEACLVVGVSMRGLLDWTVGSLEAGRAGVGGGRKLEVTAPGIECWRCCCE